MEDLFKDLLDVVHIQQGISCHWVGKKFVHLDNCTCDEDFDNWLQDESV